MGIHPNITSIIRLRDRISQALYQDQEIKLAVRLMKALIDNLEPEDRHELDAVKKRILIDLQDFKSMGSRNLLAQKVRARTQLYYDWNEQINDLLWKEGYLENAKYEPFQIQEDETKFE